MDYKVSLNMAKISEIRGTKISRETMHSYIDIDENLLVEKDSWYIVDNDAIAFFKARDDQRLFGECLSQDIFEHAHMRSAQYRIVRLNKKLGLLTPNFQDLKNYNYFDLYNLNKLFPGLNTRYNQLLWKDILTFISYQNIDNKEELIQELIDRYVGEWVTHQVDGNPRNLMLSRSKSNGQLDVAESYDREKCFGIDNNGFFNIEEARKVWVPAIPYSDKNFRNNPYSYDNGIDINILELFMDYPHQTQNSFERLFNINFRDLFNSYKQGLHQFTLNDHTVNYLCDIIDEKDRQKQKILSMKL